MYCELIPVYCTVLYIHLSLELHWLKNVCAEVSEGRSPATNGLVQAKSFSAMRVATSTPYMQLLWSDAFIPL